MGREKRTDREDGGSGHEDKGTMEVERKRPRKRRRSRRRRNGPGSGDVIVDGVIREFIYAVGDLVLEVTSNLLGEEKPNRDKLVKVLDKVKDTFDDAVLSSMSRWCAVMGDGDKRRLFMPRGGRKGGKR